MIKTYQRAPHFRRKTKPYKLSSVLDQHLMLNHRMQQEEPATMNGRQANRQGAVQVLPHKLVPALS
jgi:hypothetical protein